MSRVENDWELWVFAPTLHVDAPQSVTPATELNETTLAHLAAGDRVLLMLDPTTIKTDAQIGFSTVFWNTAWTRNQAPHTLGILCDPKHPLFTHFPTEYHSNWQWWELITRVEKSERLILRARATDLAGQTQPARAEWNRLGYGNNQIQEVEIRVS